MTGETLLNAASFVCLAAAAQDSSMPASVSMLASHHRVLPTLALWPMPSSHYLWHLGSWSPTNTRLCIYWGAHMHSVTAATSRWMCPVGTSLECVHIGAVVARSGSCIPLLGVYMQVQTLTDVNQRLQASLADTTKAHQAERLKRDNLHKQVMHHYNHCPPAEALCKRINHLM